MKLGTVLLIVVITLVGLAIALAAFVLHDGLSAKATPSWLETMVARNARRLAIPSSAKTQQNPMLDSPELQREARLHFADHCASCHGNDGSGHTLYGEGLYPKPPDLRLQATQDLTDGELFWIIENGVRFTGMPAFSGNGNHGRFGNHADGNLGGAQDIWELVHFIRHLPHLTPAERLEMESYNPKSPGERAEEQDENEFLGGATPKPKTDSQKEEPE